MTLSKCESKEDRTVLRSPAYAWNNANQVVCKKQPLHVRFEHHCQCSVYEVDVAQSLEDIAVAQMRVSPRCRPDYGDSSDYDPEGEM